MSIRATTSRAAPVRPCLSVSHQASFSGAPLRRLPTPIAGGSNPFVDPALIAPDAPIFWAAGNGTAVLDALAERPPTGTPLDLVLAELPCIRQVVFGPGDVEHLLIRTSERSLTIRLTGHRASQAPVRLTYLVPARPRVKETAAILATIPDLMTMRPRWMKRTRDQELIRDAFVALDGRSAGASHREVAEFIVGVKRVQHEWPGRGGWLKERMRRALDKGQELRDGGYWKLVEQACRFKF